MQQARGRRPNLRIEHPLPGKTKIICHHGRAIGPMTIIPQVKNVATPTVQNLPGPSNAGNDVKFWGALYQPAEELVQNRDSRSIEGQSRIQARGFGARQPEGPPWSTAGVPCLPAPLP
jgi:hypothetical protein